MKIMKKIYIFVVLIFFMLGLMTGCSKTWSGVKQDTNKAWKGTKRVVHDATA